MQLCECPCVYLCTADFIFNPELNLFTWVQVPPFPFVKDRVYWPVPSRDVFFFFLLHDVTQFEHSLSLLLMISP